MCSYLAPCLFNSTHRLPRKKRSSARAYPSWLLFVSAERTMTIYTSRLIVVPNYGNQLRRNSSSNSSYSFQYEVFRSTLIVLPNSTRKRFIEGIELRCGHCPPAPVRPTYQQPQPQRFRSLSPVATTSDLYSGDESICEYYPRRNTPMIGESYFDVRHRLLARSNLLSSGLRDDTDIDDNDSVACSSSIGYSSYSNNLAKKYWHL